MNAQKNRIFFIEREISVSDMPNDVTLKKGKKENRIISIRNA
jgi:hypothetical protein